MKLSTRGKYGLYAMHYLASRQGEGPQSLQQIASTGVPKQYLEQLLGNLRRAGLIRSVRGASGGYQLTRRPEDVTLLEILDAMEGPIELSECASDEGCCAKSGDCPVRSVWRRVTDSINRELAAVKLSEMLHNDPQGDEAP